MCRKWSKKRISGTKKVAILFTWLPAGLLFFYRVKHFFTPNFSYFALHHHHSGSLSHTFHAEPLKLFHNINAKEQAADVLSFADGVWLTSVLDFEIEFWRDCCLIFFVWCGNQSLFCEELADCRACHSELNSEMTFHCNLDSCSPKHGVHHIRFLKIFTEYVNSF